MMRQYVWSVVVPLRPGISSWLPILGKHQLASVDPGPEPRWILAAAVNYGGRHDRATYRRRGGSCDPACTLAITPQHVSSSPQTNSGWIHRHDATGLGWGSRTAADSAMAPEKEAQRVILVGLGAVVAWGR